MQTHHFFKNKPAFRTVPAILLCAALFFHGTLSGFAYDVNLTSAEAQLGMENVKPMATDFQTYQKNLDDFFYVSINTNPDHEYGVHSAILDLTRKRAANPEDPEPLVALGHIFRILGQPAEANRFYLNAIQHKQDNYYLYVFSGLMYFQLKQYKEAFEQFDKAIVLNDHDLYAWLARGRAAREAGDTPKAVESYRRAHDLDPGNEEAAFMRSAYELSQGRKKSALKIFEDLDAGKPKNDYVRYQLGGLYLLNDQPAKTLDLWEELFSQGDRNPEFLFSLSLAYFQTEKYEKARQVLEHLRFFYPRETGVEFLLAETDRAEGKTEEAIRGYRALLAERPAYMQAYTGLVLALMEKKDIKGARAVLKEAAAYAQNTGSVADLEKMIESNPEAIAEEFHAQQRPV